MWLNKRNAYLLNGLIEIYTSTRKPVSSKELSQFLNDILNNNTKRTPTAVFGNIGVIGPKFMPYPDTISQVDRFSAYFSKILSKNPMEV